jgi:hypothetical protein
VILVDTSVWIDAGRGVVTWQTSALRSLRAIEDDIVVGDLILMEVVAGARSERQAAALEADLRRFTLVALGGVAQAVQAARHYRMLRSLGVTVRSQIDVLIATWCLERRARLLHSDRDFDPMQRHLGLRVVAG